MRQHAIQTVAGKFENLQLVMNLIHTVTTNHGKPIVRQTNGYGVVFLIGSFYGLI